MTNGKRVASVHAAIVGVLIYLVVPGTALRSQGFLTPAERTVTDSQYRKVAMTLLAADGTSVVARRDGKDFVVPLASLSQADQDFIGTWRMEAKVEPEATVPPSARFVPPTEEDYQKQAAAEWRQLVQGVERGDVAAQKQILIERGYQFSERISSGMSPWFVTASTENEVSCAAGAIVEAVVYKDSGDGDAKDGRYTLGSPRLSKDWDFVFVQPYSNAYNRAAAVRELAKTMKAAGRPYDPNSYSVSFSMKCRVLVRVPAATTPGKQEIALVAKFATPEIQKPTWSEPENYTLNILPPTKPDAEALISLWAFVTANREAKEPFEREKLRHLGMLLKLFSYQLEGTGRELALRLIADLSPSK